MLNRCSEGPRWRLWVPVILYALAIFVSSSVEQPQMVPATVGDKTLHAAAYAVLALLTLRALAGGTWNGVTPAAAVVAAALASAYGVADEVHQLFVPGRQFDPRDMLADSVGAGAACAAAWLVARVRARHRHSRIT
jgi:VanZ family protein